MTCWSEIILDGRRTVVTGNEAQMCRLQKRTATNKTRKEGLQVLHDNLLVSVPDSRARWRVWCRDSCAAESLVPRLAKPRL